MCGVCGRQIWVFSLTYTFWGWDVFFHWGNHVVFQVKFSQTKDIFICDTSEGLPRSTIHFVLWHQFLLQWWWVLVFWKVVTRWSCTNPHKMGDGLQHWFSWTSNFCFEWGKKWAHWDAIYLDIGLLFFVTHVAFGHVLQLVKANCENKWITHFYLVCSNHVAKVRIGVK